MINSPNPFESFFQNPVYLEFKNRVYNYRLRREAVQRRLKVAAPGRILEIGSGISTMTDGGIGILFSDISWEAVRYLKEKHIAQDAAAMSMTHISLQDASVRTVICSEVLEHIPDDKIALSELRRVLVPGGSLILTVPLHSYYYSLDDRFVGHQRRYEPKALIELLKSNGFDNFYLEKVTGILDKTAYWLVVWIYSIVIRFKKKGGKDPKTSIALKFFLPLYILVNNIFAFLVKWEARIMPLATTAVLLVHCQRKS